MTILTEKSSDASLKEAQLRDLHLSAHTKSVSVITSTPMTLDEILTPRLPLLAKPFDRWKPLGGGTDKDMFRRFKILPAEEEAFLTHWARKQIASGIFERDDSGALVFRVRSNSTSDLSILQIGRSDIAEPTDTQWLHIYDEDGVSWLTQFRCIDVKNFPLKIYNTAGLLIHANGMIGRYGPSGLTVKDFWNRHHGGYNDDVSDTLPIHEQDKANCM